MGTQNFKTVDIKGFSPAVEPTKSQELFALTGRNYIFDAKGPKSAFGNGLLLPYPLGRPIQTQGFRIKLTIADRCFTITSDSILEWDEGAGGWQLIYVIPDTSTAGYRWTWGYLRGKVFFCHPSTGILVYDTDTGICQPHKGPGVPAQAIAIAENNGRLTVIDEELFSWSAPSDGMNFAPGPGGAGFQLISDRVPGTPIMVTSYTSGCLTWCSGGVMRSEFAGDTGVYRHRALQTDYRPVNSFCTVRVGENTVVILDERGLFKCTGEAPTPYAPLFNEFLSQYIMDNNLKVGNNLRLEWDELNQLMYVSTSLSYADPIFEQAFVLYPNLDKWGQFNEAHYGIVPLLIQQSERADDYYGFVDSTGFVRHWGNTGTREVVRGQDDADGLSADLVYPLIQKPVAYADDEDGLICSSSMVANTRNDILVTQPADYYPRAGLTPLAPVHTGLDAMIQIGLFRPTGDSVSDEMVEVLNLLIRSTDLDNTFTGTEFNITAPQDESWSFNQPAGDAIGFAEGENYINHKLRVYGTLDGSTVFSWAEPDLIGFVRKARYYACSVIGVWHIFELSAEELGESFHPVTFEITATGAGRLL